MRQTITQNEETRKSLEAMLQNQMGEIKSHAIAIRNLELQVGKWQVSEIPDPREHYLVIPKPHEVTVRNNVKL